MEGLREIRQSINWNVGLSLIYTVGNLVAFSLCQGQLLASYLFLMTHGSNSFVGVINALTGCAQIVAAIPAGILGDQYRRDQIFKVGGVIGIFCVILSLMGFLIPTPLELGCDETSVGVDDDEPPVECAKVGMVLETCFGTSCIIIYFMAISWGMWNGVNNPTLESIFADSVVTGNRTGIYTLKYVLFRVSQSLGPLLTCVMLLVLGDEWELSVLRPILASGAIIWIGAVITTFLFNDDRALGSESEGINSTESTETEYSKVATTEQEEDNEFISKPKNFFERVDQIEIEEEETEFEEEKEGGTFLVGFLGSLHPSSRNFVPLMLCTSDFINSIAAGMTIQFFPLFFEYSLDMTPVQVSLLYSITYATMGFGSILTERCAKKTGRITMIFVARLIGISLLCVMTTTTIKVLVSSIYVIRSFLMRSPVPLIRSILMDVVKKSDRSKWNAVESFSSFSFLGSAMLGGFLIDEYGYGKTFLYTAALQYFALVPLLPLFWLFDEKKVKENLTEIEEELELDDREMQMFASQDSDY